jgi:membrane-associated phospholipid phosphatase
MDTIRAIDWWVLHQFSALTEAHTWAALGAAALAEFLVVVPFLSLYILWRQPEPAGRHHGNQKAVIMAVMGVFLALAAKSITGFIVARPRPFVTDPDFFHLPLQVDPVSFPSGHTLVAFVIAISLWQSGLKKLGGWMMVIAALIALGRVASGVHYPTDILGGIIIAFFCSFYLHREASSLRRYLPNH